ncbi:MAG: response regulator [Candidatus Endonucleobacter bathymodioli]|uniref:histidine kinase n=1 Tax=Candidatus Endonucleibacter bathymodioli TaxID=539814 RepID=A0AA90P277_9GAMM|nr:response regulator [Candidatus Endonucleobacter bathymodioli]
MSVYEKHSTRQMEAGPILLVDDNPLTLQILLQALSSHGYKVLITNNGESALKIVAQEKPALILLDIMMQGIDGYEVCRRLKANTDTENITVIFLSALNAPEDKVRGLELGAVDYISKPFQTAEVIARVKMQLKIRKLELDLSDRNKQLEQDKTFLLESMREGIFGLNNRGGILFINHAAMMMTGWSSELLKGGSLIDLLFEKNQEEKDGQLQSNPIQITLNNGNSTTVKEAVFRRRYGTPLPVHYSCTPIIANGKINGAVVVFNDITKKKNRKKALTKALEEIETQKDKLARVSRLSFMGEMAAGFAHEVNQPLTAISNYAQVAKRLLIHSYSNDKAVNDLINKINQQARRAGDIVFRIRSFVKKPDHILDWTNLNKLIRDVCKLSQVDIRNNSMELFLELDDRLLDVKVDAVQIQQVLLNLIRNAVEAMKDLEPKALGVKIKTEMISVDFVKVSVIDHGCGLTEGAEEKLFTPFYTTKTDGVGIGLSVCRSIIQFHGGKLSFERISEGGTIFYFTIPVTD